VRACAAIYVVLHHIWLTTYPDYPGNSGPFLVGWLGYGHLAVTSFIVVSGFSLAIRPARQGQTLQGGVGTFFARRGWRILPTYWAALALSAVVYGLMTPADTGDKITPRSLLVHAALVQDVLNSPKPNGAFWSIAVECQIYLLFPLMLWLLRRRGPLTMACVVTTAVVAAYILAGLHSSMSHLLNLTPQFAALFAFGMVAATVLTKEASTWSRGRTRVTAGAAGLLFSGVVALCMVQGLAWVDSQYFWVDLLVGVSMACAIAAMAAQHLRPLERFFSSAPLRRVGRFSYSVYCVHLPLLWLTWHFGIAPRGMDTDAAFLTLVGIGVPVVLLGSWLFSLVFEQPFLTRRSWSAWHDGLKDGPWMLVRGGRRDRLAPAPAVTPNVAGNGEAS